MSIALISWLIGVLTPNKSFGAWTFGILAVLHGIYYVYAFWAADLPASFSILTTLFVIGLTYGLMVGAAMIATSEVEERVSVTRL